MGQLPLFGANEAPRIDRSFPGIERIDLGDGAWLDLARGWLLGDAALFRWLFETVAWRSEERVMYDRVVEVPRRFAVLAQDPAPHAVLADMRSALDARYGSAFERLSVALYRDGRDSVAFHGDYIARRMREALVATVSVGAPRRFLVRPAGGGPARGFMLGWGDLLVMGGTCQRTHQHAVPKVVSAAPRIAIMFRPVWTEDDPDTPPTVEQEGLRASAKK
jgi:alkylated DNA repair dioxygenase AlkB